MKTAKKSDWGTKPLPEERTVIDLHRKFTGAEMEVIRRGLIPMQMEDRWFVYWEEARLYFHRSWTGYCIYVVHFNKGNDTWRMVRAEVNRDGEQYGETSDNADAAMIPNLVDLLLLGKRPTYPGAGSTPQETALRNWSHVGRAMPGRHPPAGNGPGTSLPEGYASVSEGGFVVHHRQGEREYAEIILGAALRGMESLREYFSLTDPLPGVRAVVVDCRDEFDRLVRDLLGVEIEVPSNPARIAQTQRTDMVLLSPSAYEAHSPFDYRQEDFRRLVVHELVHIVEEFLSPNIEATPRWWGEGLAVYLSGQWRWEREYYGPVKQALENGPVPSFAEIRSGVSLAYDWGWTLVRFMEEMHGKSMIRKIVQECSDGRVLGFLGPDEGRIEENWREWLLSGGLGFQ